MMNDEITIRTMQDSDDATQASRLIFQTSDSLFKTMFGKKEIAVSRIETLVKLENNIFSYKNILVAENKGNILGILLGYNENAVNIRRMKKDFKMALPFFFRLKSWMVLAYTDRYMSINHIEGFYVQNLCVDSMHRGKRIGYRLLEQCVLNCKEKGIKNIYLDVESSNSVALQLYRKIGFKLEREIYIKLAKIVLYRMKKALID